MLPLIELKVVLNEQVGIECLVHIDCLELPKVPLVAVHGIHYVQAQLLVAVCGGHQHVIRLNLVIKGEDDKWNLVRLELTQVLVDPLQIIEVDLELDTVLLVLVSIL